MIKIAITSGQCLDSLDTTWFRRMNCFARIST